MTCTPSTLTAADGVRLSVRTFAPQGPVQGTVVLVHGYLEHGGRYEPLAGALCAQNMAMVVADLRGHGHSDGPRGHVGRFEDYHRDLNQVLGAQQPGPLCLFGHSLGGLIALDYGLRGQAPLAGLMVTNPFIAPALRIPKAKVWLGRITQRLWPTLAVRAGLKPTDLTGDAEMLAEHRADPLIFDRTTARWFHEVTCAQQRVAQGGVLPMPFLGILGMVDPIASPQASLRCFAKLQAPMHTVWQRPGELHEVLNERGRHALFEQIAQWAQQRFSAAGGRS
jgi:alpha-beta hydrolase superfamily lysophospholipase